MRRYGLVLLLFLTAVSGCVGGFVPGRGVSRDDGRSFRKETDRCARCHAVWSGKSGYYREWDRYGIISGDGNHPPAGYVDPWGVGAPANPYREYYYTGWWADSGGEDRLNPYPEMHLDGYGPVNEGKSTPGDFSGKVIVVDPSGKGDVRTIQDGVNRASAGATVFVRPGTYRESVRLKRGVRLWGADPKTTVIRGGTKQSAIIAANGCDISGFTISGTGMDDDRLEFTAGIYATGCDTTLVIRGNIFSGGEVVGILVEGSREGGTSGNPAGAVPPEKSLQPLKYREYARPRIIGNTFHLAASRAVYCIHASPEIANNVFAGNVAALGMTRDSRPFVHHNVFYRNKIALDVNRSRPVVAYNIMSGSVWGQRVTGGAFPAVHHNVVWDSPWFRGFGEDGAALPHVPFPGTGERTVDPGFANPGRGDFRIAAASAIKALSNTRSGTGLIRGHGIQYPPAVSVAEPRDAHFPVHNDTLRAVVAEIDRRNALIRSLGVSYTIEYRNFLKVKRDRAGNPVSETVAASPVSGTDYRAYEMISPDGRRKSYRMRMFAGRKAVVDSGMVFFDGERVRVPSGVFKTDSRLIGDINRIGERPVRENIGGIFLDYDQYLNGAIGPGGTFCSGYLRMLGGRVLPARGTVDGASCVVIRYPPLGEDQYYLFYLDPLLGYRPRKLEQYCAGRLFRRIDGYRYETVSGIPLPVAAAVTDYAVTGRYAGKAAGVCVMTVVPGSLVLNGERE